MENIFNLTAFIASFLMVSTSSLLFGLSINSKSPFNKILYSILILISQVILTFEALSVFKAISPAGVLACNMVVCVVAIVISKDKIGIEILKQVQNEVIGKYFNALRSDRVLLILSVLFCFCAVISLYFAIFVPANDADTLSYRLTRVAFWLANGSLEHYESVSLRALVFPINAELMMLWSMVFVKRDYFTIFPAFLSYFGCLGVIGAYLNTLKISPERILWVLLIVASLPIMILEASSCQSDLFVGFLLFSSFYLFYVGLKDDDRRAVLFSALAYGIALGAKSTAILFIPAFVVVFILLAKKFNKYRYLLNFLFWLIPAFMLLSAYNYLLNYQGFGNFLGSASIVNDHVKMEPGRFVSSLPLYAVRFADFSGIDLIEYINPFISKMADMPNFAQAITSGPFKGFNYKIHENYSGYGFLGYLLIFPVVAFALTKLRASGKRSFHLGICGVFLVLFFFTIAFVMGFSVWNIRYFATAIVLSAPVTVFSYRKKLSFYKLLIALIVAFNYIVIPLNISGKPFFSVGGKSRSELRLRNELDFSVYWRAYYPLKYAKQIIPDGSSIGLVFNEGDIIYPFFEANPSWKIHSVRYEKLVEQNRFDEYDYLITTSDKQSIHPLKYDYKHNYYFDMEKKQIVFKNTGDNAARVLYAKHPGRILFDETVYPEIQLNLIDEDKLLRHFEKIKGIKVKHNFKNKDRLYWIYRKIRQHAQ